MAVERDETLPVFPVRNAVLFPGMVTPFDMGRPTSLAALERAQTGSPSLMIVVAQRSPDTEEPLQGDLYPVGCVAEVVNRLPNIRGGERVILGGVARALLRSVERLPTYVRATVSRVPTEKDLTYPQRSLVEEIREGAITLARREGAPADALEVLEGIREPSDVVDLVAGNLEATVHVKIRWLGAPLVERIALVLDEVRRKQRAT
jgi:ATP-dependent Lon protease